jgi:hypothetical protein
MKKCSINYFNKHQEFVIKINNRIKCRKYTGASELVEIAYFDNYEYIDDTLKELDKDLMEETEVMR